MAYQHTVPFVTQVSLLPQFLTSFTPGHVLIVLSDYNNNKNISKQYVTDIVFIVCQTLVFELKKIKILLPFSFLIIYFKIFTIQFIHAYVERQLVSCRLFLKKTISFTLLNQFLCLFAHLRHVHTFKTNQHKSLLANYDFSTMYGECRVIEFEALC